MTSLEHGPTRRESRTGPPQNVEDDVEQDHVAPGTALSSAAADGAVAEHQLSIRQALHVYWKAIAWSIVVSWAVIMESYDIQIIGSFYAYPSFQMKYGVPVGNGAYSVPSQWQVALSTGSSIGVIIGIFANGWLVDRYGHKKLLLTALVFQAAFIFITFFSPNVRVLLVGEILCGLPWGIFNTIAPSYAVEVCPMVLRGYLTTFVNLCWVIGHIIAASVLEGLVENTTEWSYRIPFAIQWVWPLPLFVAICFAPHSPWWLVRANRLEEAERSLCRLSIESELVDSKRTLALMVHTTQLEASLSIGGSYGDCFKGTDLRRTEIACVTWASQAFVGFAIQGYATYFFEQAGLPASDAFKLSLGTYSIAFCGTVGSWFLQTYLGRRTIVLLGLAFMTPIMFAIGFLALAAPTNYEVPWAQAVLLLVWFGVYGLTIGPMPYVIAAEISSSKLRTKTISLSRNAYYIFQVVSSVVAPYMLNPSNANLKGQSAFPAGCFSVVLFIWAFFRLPEAKGRIFEELDILFATGISARRFKGQAVDPYQEYGNLGGAHGRDKQRSKQEDRKDGDIDCAAPMREKA